MFRRDFPLHAGLLSAPLLSPERDPRPAENGKRPNKPALHPYL